MGIENIEPSDLVNHQSLKRKPRCLFVVATEYNLSLLAPVAAALADWECWFTPLYSARTLLYFMLRALGIAQNTMLRPDRQARLLETIARRGLKSDLGAKGTYDIIVLGTDIFIPQNLRRHELCVLVQEGWIWTRNWKRQICSRLHLPPLLAGVNGAGLSHRYKSYCVLSQGYRSLFEKSGVDPGRLVVTGLPTLDAVKRDFSIYSDRMPPSEYVLVTTHPGREYFEYENRRKLLAKARLVANGRPIIIKFHPHERIERAEREAARWLPEASIVNDDVNKLIANCSALVTTYSTTVFYALLLDKEVHCTYKTADLLSLLPEQKGDAAVRIAEVCRASLANKLALKTTSGPIM